MNRITSKVNKKEYTDTCIRGGQGSQVFYLVMCGKEVWNQWLPKFMCKPSKEEGETIYKDFTFLSL